MLKDLLTHTFKAPLLARAVLTGIRAFIGVLCRG